jgi:hypothetical protein
VVAGVGGPATTESTAKLTPLLDEGGREEEEKNLVSSPSPLTPHPLPPEDDDEEVSWQSAARASLETVSLKTNKPLSVKPSITKNPEPAPRAVPAKTEAFKKETPKDVVAKSSSPSASPTTQPPEELPPTEAQFTQEELPTDFWSNEAEPPPTSESSDDELFETATSAPGQGPQSKFGQSKTPKPAAKLPFDMPLFNELQGLFPGKIIRVDMKQQKQTEESEESTAPTNEAVNVVESED